MTDLCGGVYNAVAAEKGERGNMMSWNRGQKEQDMCLASGEKTPFFGSFIYFAKMIAWGEGVATPPAVAFVGTYKQFQQSWGHWSTL